MPRGNEPPFDHRDLANYLRKLRLIGHWLSLVGRLHQEKDMQIGFNLPISGPLLAPEIVTRIAQEGEALG